MTGLPMTGLPMTGLPMTGLSMTDLLTYMYVWLTYLWLSYLRLTYLRRLLVGGELYAAFCCFLSLLLPLWVIFKINYKINWQRRCKYGH